MVIIRVGTSQEQITKIFIEADKQGVNSPPKIRRFLTTEVVPPFSNASVIGIIRQYREWYISKHLDRVYASLIKITARGISLDGATKEISVEEPFFPQSFLKQHHTKKRRNKTYLSYTDGQILHLLLDRMKLGYTKEDSILFLENKYSIGSYHVEKIIHKEERKALNKNNLKETLSLLSHMSEGYTLKEASSMVSPNASTLLQKRYEMYKILGILDMIHRDSDR